MAQIDHGRVATVPKLDRSGLGQEGGLRARVNELIALGPVAVVVTGLGLTAAWMGFLAWCLFSFIRWALG